MSMTLTPQTRAVYPELVTHPLWRHFYGHYKGVSLIKESDVWSEVEDVDADRIAAAQEYLQGGLAHVVSDAIGAELLALGYEVV